MKKYLFLTAALFCAFNLIAEEIPAGYYDAINGKKDSVLKSTLSQIIYPVDWSKMTQDKPNAISEEYNAGRRYKYNTREVDQFKTHFYTWDGFLYTDTREDGTVWDMYSTRIHYMAPEAYGAVSIPDMEIEHCFPKGWWGGAMNSNENDAFRDLHHLNPANARANNNKSAYPPGYAKTDIKECSDIFTMGKNSDYGSFFVFEPCNEYKGDFARAYFYIATAYENFIWQDAAKDYMDNERWQEFKPWLQQVLLEWHRLDPVSEKEINRNNLVSDIQHNRNPFIDYPELVEYIWGTKQGQTVQLAALTFTGDEAYELPIETLVSRALPASDISRNGFTANWKNAGKDCYMLDVYTSTTTGHNDTLLNMPLMGSSLIKADTEHFSYSGSFGTTGVGKSSVTFGTKSNPLKLTIKGLTIPTNSQIVVRAMAPLKLNDTDGAKMKISADSKEIANQELTHDEEYYRYNIPAGTNNILIEQGNGILFNVQQLFIITGDETTTHQSLEGYPKEIDATSYAVECPMQQGETIYYTITPDGLRTSMPVSVIYSEPQGVCNTSATQDSQTTTHKEIREGKIVIIHNASIYTPLGQKIQ